MEVVQLMLTIPTRNNPVSDGMLRRFIRQSEKNQPIMLFGDDRDAVLQSLLRLREILNELGKTDGR